MSRGSGGARALAARYDLGERAAAQLERLQELLADDPLAPTAVRDRRRVLDDHLADALVALELDEVRSATTMADIGSGAGLPGLPLAIAQPESHVWLVESAARKCAFLERAATVCEVENVSVVHGRAEEVAAGGLRVQVVTARALASLAVVAEYAAPLLQVGGTLVAWRGRRDTEAEADAAAAAPELGLAVGEIRQVLPYTQAEARYLHLMSKVMETPGRFPRRAGMAVKRPLGR